MKVCEICGERAVKTIGKIAWYCERHYNEIITTFAKNYLQRRIRDDSHRKRMILENLKSIVISLRKRKMYKVNIGEIRKLIGLSHPVTKKYLKQLEKFGLVSEKDHGIWEIHEEYETVMV